MIAFRTNQNVHQARNGFSLLETLVAMALCGVLLSFVFSSILIDERMRAAGERQIARSSRAWGINEDISGDLRNLVAKDVVSADVEEKVSKPFESSVEERLLDVRERYLDLSVPGLIEPVGFVGEPHSLTMHLAGPSSRFVQSRQLRGNQSERVVAYVVTNGRAVSLAMERENGRPKLKSWKPTELSGLIRIERPAWPVSADLHRAVPANEDVVTRISADVASIDFRYFDGRDWVNRWDGNERQSLPNAIEVTTRFIDDDLPRSLLVAVKAHQRRN